MNRNIARIGLILILFLACIGLSKTDNRVIAEGGVELPAYEADRPLQDGKYIINSVEDWMALQSYSRSQDLSGCEFEYIQNGTQSTYQLTSAIGFEGIGSEAYPFTGKIYSNFAVGIITFQTEVPMFKYLSTSAEIDNMSISVMGNSSCAGFADKLIVSGGDLTLRGIRINKGTDSAYITNAEGTNAGGLFAGIVNSGAEAHNISFADVVVNVPVKTTGAGCAGGWIGHIEGKVNLVFDKEYDIANTVSQLDEQSEAVMGGLVGDVDSATVSLKVPDAYHLYCSGDTGTSRGKATAGAVIGRIASSAVTLDGDIRVTGGKVYGKNIGGLAGEISGSDIVLKHVFECTALTLYPFDSTGADEAAWSAAGMFAGKLVDSAISHDESLSGAAIIVNGCTSASAYNVVGNANENDNSKKYNVGGLAGYAADTDIVFDETHPCEIYNFRTDKTSGNISSGIGYYEGTANRSVSYINIKSKDNVDVRLVCYKGSCGGIIGKVVSKGSATTVTISNCSAVLPKISVEINESTKGCFSLGIGCAANDGSNAKVSIKSVDLRITEAAKGYYFSRFTLGAYGGAIGIADADINADNITIENRAAGNKTDIQTSNLEYYGGLIGIVKGHNNVAISNVSIGKNAFWGNKYDFGGLLGRVEEASVVRLSGLIELNGGTEGIEQQKAAEPKRYVGNIAGSIDDALIYIDNDEGTVYNKSALINGNEIGNYGGVIRNINTAEGKLIDGFSLTGAIDNTIDSVEDFMRLAIVLNTSGEIMPTGNPGDTFSDINSKAYTLTADEYDLRATGLMCIGRNYYNAAGGEAYVPFTGGITGKAGKSKIIYELNGYGLGQSSLALFPYAGEGVAFKNLSLEYTIEYNRLAYTTDSVHYVNPAAENAGGLICYASGDVTIDNVSYKGVIRDYSQGNSKIKNSQFTGEYDYLGGLIGQYSGNGGADADIKNISAELALSCSDPTHIMGGMIAGVTSATATGVNPLTVNVSGTNSITGNVLYSDNGLNNALKNRPVMLSSFITVIGNFDLPGEDYAYDGRYSVSVDGLSVSGITQSVNSKNSATSMGGFLGYKWVDVDMVMSDVTVGADSPAKLSGNAGFGGLVDTVFGKLCTDNIHWAAAAIDVKNAANAENCGLLVRDGQYLYLGVKDYVIEDAVTLSNYAGTYFDDIAGQNVGGSDEKHGGIVAVSETAGPYLGRAGALYKSYNVKLGSKTNPNTRYYYDIDSLDYAGASNTLASPDDIMIWHILHYINPAIRKTVCDNVPDWSATSISGNIDMTGYSIYPTPVLNESYTATGARIVFNAQGIIDGERGKAVPLYPDDTEHQHNRLHSGLLDDASGICAEGLTLSGTYSAVRSGDSLQAGALVAGQLYGQRNDTTGENVPLYKDIENKFTDITLDNLWCVASGALDYDNPVGLMLADISSGAKVTFDGIAMTGYSEDKVNTSSKAASALIGNVGDIGASYITLSFKNMDIADAADGKSDVSLKSGKSDEALARASFIYSYDYADNSNAMYIFTYDDFYYGRISNPATRNITLGLELDDNESTPNYAKEEYIDKDMPAGCLLDHSEEIQYLSTNYLPYVCTSNTKRLVLINPKVGNITDGCGTYEDPYVIENTKQLMSLYRYMYREAEYKSVLEAGNWSINMPGSDDIFCDKSAQSHTLSAYNEKEENGFPATGELSKAYYRITNDIDLTYYSEFTGFGSADEPFTGVFVGKETEPSVYPVITMPMQNGAEKESYGFVQYTKGCVVKNLDICYPDPVVIAGAAGGVIAVADGGESIIDNVSFYGATDIKCYSPKNTKAVIGGYVGLVNRGGVILRNINCDSLKSFVLNYSEGTTEQDHVYCGSMTGRVMDGYVIYDGDRVSSDKAVVTSVADFGEAGAEPSLPFSRSYDIVNSAYLDNRVNGNKITYSPSGYTISGNAQLQIMSMALNSGALTYNGALASVGCSTYSRQRHGAYDKVGDCTADYADRLNVIACDNYTLNRAGQRYESFLFKYFDFGANTIWSSGEYISGTAVSALNKEGNTFSYVLTGASYDMSVFEKAFRGLGARYHDGENVFRCNLKAQEAAQINVHMIADDYEEAENVALLNKVKVTNSAISISGITLSGVIENHSETEDGDTTEFIPEHSAGGFISILSSAYGITFTDVTLDGLSISSRNCVGGLIAYYPDNKTITIENCGVSNSGVAKTKIKGMAYAGGFVGYTKSKISCTVTGVNGLTVDSGDTSADAGQRDTGRDAGGLFAKVENNSVEVNKDGAVTVDLTDISVRSAGMPVKVGGIVGWCNGATINNINIVKLEVGSLYDTDVEYSNGNDKDKIPSVGGVIGFLTGTVTMNNVTVGSKQAGETVYIHMDIPKLNTNNAGIGGMIGRTYDSKVKITLNNVKLLGKKISDNAYTTSILGKNNAGGIVSNAWEFLGSDITVEGALIQTNTYIGGIVGYHEDSKVCNVNNSIVKDTRLSFREQARTSADGTAGGISGCSVGDLVASDIRIEGLIVTPEFCNAAGGVTGRIGASYNSNATVQISGENYIKANKICGGVVGGVVGYVENKLGDRTNTYSNIYVEDNILLANNASIFGTGSYGSAAAGGFLGSNGSSGMNVTVYNITINNNIIAGCAADKNKTTYIGGLAGRAKNKTNVYGLRMETNYIGRINENITRESVSDKEELIQKLYYAQVDNSSYVYNQTKYGEALDNTDKYKYSYHQGTMIGYCEPNSFARLINVSVFYAAPLYRPVSDIGMDMSYNTASVKDMQKKARGFAAIVYDGEVTNNPVTAPEWVAAATDTDNTTRLIEEPYVFGNLEHIINAADSCGYWLDNNYQYNDWLDGDDVNLSVNSIYESTYKTGEVYKSQLKYNDSIVPVVVFDTADNGNIDQVLHSYVNMLTNNSGALNSRVAANDKSIKVTAEKVRISGGSIFKVDEPAGVSVTTDDSMIYTFEASSQGDELDPDTGEGTFTLIHIDYNDEGGNTKWSLDIPVYVEKRLKLYSNMRMLSGTKYDAVQLKTDGKFMTDSDREQFLLPMGTGYSLYCEYVYTDILDMSSIYIPKKFLLDARQDNGQTAELYFTRGTKITMIPIEGKHPGVPYYYTVEDDRQTEVSFVDFKNEAGDNYSLKDIKTLDVDSTYTDVCNNSYTDAVSEQFVLYINPPEIEKTQYSVYKLHISPDWTCQDGAYSTLKTRTEINEHCYERVLELPGVKYNIEDEYTNISSDSMISKGGMINASLRYSIKGASTYWASVRNDNIYVDVAFYLLKKDKDSDLKTRIALPAGTVVTYGASDVSVLVNNQDCVYYYQGKNNGKQNGDYIKVDDLRQDTTNDITIKFDFTNADMSGFEAFKDADFYVGAELVVTYDKDMPASGEIKDTWQSVVKMELADDIGFALDADELLTLGMNRYEPERSDSGVVQYTASIVLPKNGKAVELSKKDYTIIYEIEEKTSQRDADNKPVYNTYTGDDISLYTGEQSAGALDKGITAVTYHFTEQEMQSILDTGIVMLNDTATSDEGSTPCVVKTRCTLIADCDSLNMTNYRVKAYLIVSDSDETANLQGYVKTMTKRTLNWSAADIDALLLEPKSDFFVFTVARIKKDMR